MHFNLVNKTTFEMIRFCIYISSLLLGMQLGNLINASGLAFCYYLFHCVLLFAIAALLFTVTFRLRR